MGNDSTFHIRPAGRHLLTVGRDLIQDQYAAVVELVKNAYDADSPDVTITFETDLGRAIVIVVEDHGHGMARETVINSWLVPSTRDKLKRGTSPNGRIMQGRKGIGRYAAGILGNELLLETISAGKKTTVLLNWDDFEKANYLDDVDVLVETTKSSDPHGTRLTIRGDKDQLEQWNKEQIDKLQFELRKLVSPMVGKFKKGRKPDEFSITLIFQGFSDVLEEETDPIRIKITPYPVVDLYDYRIHGEIDSRGHGLLTYQCQKARNTVSEKIPVELEGGTGCGSLRFDLRVYDREPDAIEQLIERGLKNKDGDYISKLNARRLLNELNGIGVYRNGFRIRPLGDPDFDWLELNKHRVQEPTIRIGINQVIGLVEIESEEKSELEEKSARDGLRDNAAFRRLKEVTGTVVNQLEQRRYEYRFKAGLSRRNKKIEAQLEQLSRFEDLRNRARERLAKAGASKSVLAVIDELLVDDERETSKAIAEIRETVAVYQGHATLGKIMNVVLHEARRPLNFFKNQIPNLAFWSKEFKAKKDADVLDELLNITPGLSMNSNLLVELFKRLDPLAAAKRGPQRDLEVKKMLGAAFHVFEEELVQHQIALDIKCPNDLTVHAWEQDIYSIITNLIDNSFYWLVNKKKKNREISVNVIQHDGLLQCIDFRDNGPGIEPHLIASGVIFEPEFSTKPPGVGQGLGLAIAGEAASRNGFELKAIASDSGAYFRLQAKEKKEN